MGRMQRNKGASGEREFFSWLSDMLGKTVKRKLGQAREGGNDGDAGPLVIEVKRYAAFAVMRHFEQCEKAAGTGKFPVVALREDDGEWMVLLRAQDFLELSRDEILGRWDA